MDSNQIDGHGVPLVFPIDDKGQSTSHALKNYLVEPWCIYVKKEKKSKSKELQQFVFVLKIEE